MINTATDSNKPRAMLKAEEIDESHIRMFVNNQEKDVRYTIYTQYILRARLKKNLMSLSQIEERNKEILFKNRQVKIRKIISGEMMCEAYRL